MSWLKENIALLLILIIGFALRIAAILADPFLHPWDERFHALVARNMMTSPLTPMLRANPITDNYDIYAWCCNHIWLHKQPVFMWQMALSMKVFGVAEWSMRLPSALMGTILIFIIYRITILIEFKKRIAILTAMLLAFSNFHVQLIAGIHGMEHNDVAHGFYVIASIWALFEYQKSNKWYWIVLVGIFSGAAILNKWLTGLLVYLVWAVVITYSLYEKRLTKKQIVYFTLSLLVCCIVFLPWQFYIHAEFPELATYEREFNTRHITEVIEPHSGGYFFYLKYFKELYAGYLFVCIPLGFLISLRSKSIKQPLNRSVIVAIGFVFLFYSIVVKTKLESYLFFIAPLVLIYIAIVLDFIMEGLSKFSKSILVTSIVFVLAATMSFNPIWVSEYFSSSNKERNDRIYNATIYKNIENIIPDTIHVVMNVNSMEDVDVMFYNKGITAYHWWLPEEEFKSFEKRKIPIAVFESHGNYGLPEYVLKYPYIYIIKKPLRNFY